MFFLYSKTRVYTRVFSLFEWRITQPEYDKKLELFNDAQQNINLDSADHTQADFKYHITARQKLELARRAGELFKRANDAEKNELLKRVLSNATFDGRKLVFSIRKPFDTISNVKGFPVLLRNLSTFINVNWIEWERLLERSQAMDVLRMSGHLQK